MAAAGFLAVPIVSGAVSAEADAARELAALRVLVPSFRVQSLPTAAGELTLTPEQSLTIEALRGIDLDSDPPVLGSPPKPYDRRMADTFAPGTAPYIAPEIEPFRLKQFSCEFNYGGWHNFTMTDYASAHGFSILYPYTRTVEEGTHLPTGTKWLTWGGYVDWHTWLGKHDLPDGRYDMLVDRDLVQMHVDEGVFLREPQPTKLSQCGDYLMIDMEHPVLPPPRLRTQGWYPKDAAEAERQAFEKRYYEGYARTYTSAVEAARRQGWHNISIYGWAPYGRTWGGLEKPDVDPGTDHAWNAFGRRIYECVDLINCSVYCFYWSAQNVAYTLANIDSNMAMVNSMPTPKPVRPYFWTLLHGGGAGWRWWRGQPLATEEKRAMIAMAFFTGIDGFDTWNWSGTGSHHVTPALMTKEKAGKQGAGGGDYFSSGADVMLKDGFELSPEGADAGAAAEPFRRYDVVHVLEVEEAEGTVRFQKIRPGTKGAGVGEGQPAFVMPVAELTPHLRIKSEPVAGMVEGMALVKPFEAILRRGEVKIDVPSRKQFKETLPIVRRVKLGPIHVLVTYDPRVVYGGEPRGIVLEDFDGRPGLTLRLPADEQTRIFVLRDE